jgi:hypothetical protein
MAGRDSSPMAVIDDGTTIPSDYNTHAQESPPKTPTSTELPLSPVPGQKFIDITQSPNSSVATAMPGIKEEIQPDLQTEIDQFDKKGPTYRYPSGVPGLGNSILGPRIPGSASSKSIAPSTNQEETNHAQRSNLKRKFSVMDAEETPSKFDNPVLSNNVDRPIDEPLSSQKHVSSSDPNDRQHSTNLSRLVQDINNILTPYTRLHSSCPATKPLQLILASLSSSSFTATTLMVLLTDARELLKVLAQRQMGVYDKLEPAMGRFQASGMESILTDAKQKAERTESDVQKLGGWLAQCDAIA